MGDVCESHDPARLNMINPWGVHSPIPIACSNFLTNLRCQGRILTCSLVCLRCLAHSAKVRILKFLNQIAQTYLGKLQHSTLPWNERVRAMWATSFYPNDSWWDATMLDAVILLLLCECMLRAMKFRHSLER